jgi:hypothetical protein
MEAFQLGDQSAYFDRGATEGAYALLEAGDADMCGCIECKNFALQRTTAYPPDFHALLERLGIDALKEGEAFGYGPEPSGRILYGGWFYFVGAMQTAGERQVKSDKFSYFVGTAFPNPPPPFHDQPVLAIEFMTRLPWVLAEPAE